MQACANVQAHRACTACILKVWMKMKAQAKIKTWLSMGIEPFVKWKSPNGYFGKK